MEELPDDYNGDFVCDLTGQNDFSGSCMVVSQGDSAAHEVITLAAFLISTCHIQIMILHGQLCAQMMIL